MSRHIKITLENKDDKEYLTIDITGLSTYEIIGLCRKIILQQELIQAREEYNEIK